MHGRRSGQHRVRNSIRKFNIDAIVGVKPWLAVERRYSGGQRLVNAGRCHRLLSNAVDSMTQQSRRALMSPGSAYVFFSLCYS